MENLTKWLERDYDNDEYPQGRWFKCHKCDSNFLMDRGWSPSYCPICGQKQGVVDVEKYINQE